MTEDHGPEFGTILDNGEIIVFEIPTELSNLKAIEQLDELKRQDELFFACQHYIVDEERIKIYFKRNQEYRNIQTYLNASGELKKKIAKNLLMLNRLIGTQFTTTLHPENVYVNDRGDIKLIHRGIRHVLPPIEFNEKQLLEELKELVVYIFTGYSPYIADSTPVDGENEQAVSEVNKAHTFNELLFVIENYKLDVQTEKKINSNSGGPVPRKPKGKKRTKNISLLSGVLIGFLCGLVFLYVSQIIPRTEASRNMESSFMEKQNELLGEKVELQHLLSEANKINQAYGLSIEGKTEEAITTLESVESLPVEGQKVLTTLYLESNNPEYLAKAAELDLDNYEMVVGKLVAMNSEEANTVLLGFQSDAPFITIEQAWLNKEYEQVIEQYASMKESERAKLLAAKSYLEVEQPEEALVLGEELGELSIQISSLEKLIDLVGNDDDLEDSEKEERLEELNQQLEELAK